MASNGQRPRTLLNILKAQDSLTRQRLFQPKMSVAKVKKSDKDETRLAVSWKLLKLSAGHVPVLSTYLSTFVYI